MDWDYLPAKDQRVVYIVFSLLFKNEICILNHIFRKALKE